MPWSKSDLPPAAKKLTDKQKEIFVAVANSVLEETGDEGQAIAAGLSQAKKEKDMKKSFAESLAELIEKHFGGSEKETEPEVVVTKSLDEEEKMALFVVLSPDEEDLHGDIYSEKEIEKACISYNQHCRKANLYHRVETEDFAIVQSFVTPVGFTDDTGREIKKGTWLAWTKFENEELWDQVKSGEFQGLSVGCKASVEELE